MSDSVARDLWEYFELIECRTHKARGLVVRVTELERPPVELPIRPAPVKPARRAEALCDRGAERSTEFGVDLEHFAAPGDRWGDLKL